MGVSSQHKLGLEHCRRRERKEQWGEAVTSARVGMVSFPIFMGKLGELCEIFSSMVLLGGFHLRDEELVGG